MSSPSKQTEGTVVAAFRRHYLVHDQAGTEHECVARGRKQSIACGDHVALTIDRKIGAVIEKVLPRRSLFYRADAFREKLIAANVDQIVGVVAVEPSFSDELLTRWIIAAEAQDCHFVIALNKVELPDVAAARARLATYAALGYPIIELSALQDATPLAPALKGRVSVLVGQSGMGKSTLVNALIPDANAAIGEISTALDTGRHTTTHTRAYPFDGGWVIDSPGMQEFGLGHLSPTAITSAFVDFRPYLGECRFRDCRHRQEPDCAVKAAVAAGKIEPRRYELWQRILDTHSPRVTDD